MLCEPQHLLVLNLYLGYRLPQQKQAATGIGFRVCQESVDQFIMSVR
jgi:hypothetical protein